MTMQTAIPQIPGLTAAEITAMQAAAAGLLHGTDPALAALIRAGLGDLGHPAGDGAAGTPSASRAEYTPRDGSHFMIMACHAAG